MRGNETMNKRQKKKAEMKAEIRHAKIMRSFDIAQRIIQTSIMISQIGRRPMFSNGGVIVGVNDNKMSEDEKINAIAGLEKLKRHSLITDTLHTQKKE